MIENHRFSSLDTFKQLSWKNQLSRIFLHFKPIFYLMLQGYNIGEKKKKKRLAKRELQNKYINWKIPIHSQIQSFNGDSQI